MSRPRRPAGAGGIALAATLHDPPGALLDDVRRLLPRVRRLYGAVAVATSPPTSARVRAALAAQGADGGTPATNARGPLYRLALRRALASGAPRVHYLDFDRVLHWAARRPAELRAVLALATRRPALVIGRTPRAHASHHEALVATEAAAGARFAAALGITGRLDFLVPSFVLTRAHAVRLLARSRARDAAMYGEWAAVLAGLGVRGDTGRGARLDYVECDGLDWETPDRARAAVARIGLAAWRRAFSTPAEWALRRAMTVQFQRGFVRALARRPIRGLVVRRLPPAT